MANPIRMHPPKHNQAPFILGTASPRRHRIMQELGVDFDVLCPDVEERHDDDDPCGTVVHNARAKHHGCRLRHPDAWILCADTVVEFGGQCLGKPRDLDEARRFLQRFSGCAQQVFTAVALCRPHGETELRVAASSVRFRHLSAELIDEYIARAQPLDRAGAYDIDTHGDLLIASYAGSYSNVMGLPRAVVRDWLLANGWRL